MLVGTMHYNPRSIDIARDIVEREAASGALRAVAVESCPTRWNATQESQPRGSLMRFLCDNEMQAGAEAGEDAGVAVVLADQTIEDTGRRLAQLFALTLVELCTPWNGGWSRIYDDLSQAVAQALQGEDSLGADAFFEPQLALGFPVSLVRYPLSVFVKSPLIGSIVALVALGPWLFAINDYVTLTSGYDFIAGSTYVPAADVTLQELAASASFAAVETVVFGRVLLVGLLEERNFVLARNIRKALFNSKPGGSIVAVLGMAHCTGVAKLLRESRIV